MRLNAQKNNHISKKRNQYIYMYTVKALLSLPGAYFIFDLLEGGGG